MVKRRGAKKNYRRKNTKSIARVVNSVLARRNELKDLTVDHAALAANSTSGITITKINPPAQGDSSSTRDGDQFYLKSLQLSGRANCGANANTVQRIIVFQWMEDDGVNTPDAAEILQNTNNADSLNSFFVTNPTKKFRVLSDKTYYWDAQNTSASKSYKLSISNFPMKKVSLSPAAITGVGCIYVLTCGLQAAGDFASFQSRQRYYDN